MQQPGGTDTEECTPAMIQLPAPIPVVLFLFSGVSQAPEAVLRASHFQATTSSSLRASDETHALYSLEIFPQGNVALHSDPHLHACCGDGTSELRNRSFLNSASLSLTSFWYVASITS